MRSEPVRCMEGDGVVMSMSRSAAPDVVVFATFGDLLRYLRRRARLTQRDLALAIGYSPEHISRLEHNQRVPDRATVRALFIEALHVEHDEQVVARLLELAAPRPPVVVRHTPATTAVPLASQPHPLPASVTPLVGRDAELAQVAQLMHDPACRVLTLVGLGSSGQNALGDRGGACASSTLCAWRGICAACRPCMIQIW